MSSSLVTPELVPPTGAVGSPPDPLSLTRIMDEQRTSWIQVRVAAVCAAVTFCDSYSIQAVNYAGPSIRQSLALNPAQLGTIFSISLFGMMVGSFAIGPIADRWGRRGPLVVLTGLFGLITMLTAASTAFWQIASLRLLDGLALGAALPNAYVLAAEYSPLRNRRLAVALMMVGYTFGGFLAGVVAGPLTAAYGWRPVFLIGGAAALLTAGAGALLVPDSLHVLARRSDQRRSLEKIVGRVAPQFASELHRLGAEPVQGRAASIVTLFNSQFRLVTLGLWTIAFCAMLDVYFFSSWTPILLVDAGIPVQNAILITSMYMLGCIFAAVLVGVLMDRTQPWRVMLGVLLLGAVAIGAMAPLIHVQWALALAGFGIGLGLGGASGGYNLLATTMYPSSARVTGTGWCTSIGRLGAVVGPALAATWLSAGLSGRDMYYVAMGPALFAALVTVLLRRRFRKE